MLLSFSHGKHHDAVPRLGDILVARGVIDRQSLEGLARRAHSRLGETLRAHGRINDRALGEAIAAQKQLLFVDLQRFAPDARLFNPARLSHYIRHRYVPFARGRDGLIVAAVEPSRELGARLSQAYRMPVQFVVTGGRDLARYFTSVAAQAITRRARLSLRRRYRHLTADRTFTRRQLLHAVALAAGLAIATASAPALTWRLVLIGCNLFYLSALAVKLALFELGKSAITEQRIFRTALERKAAQLTDAQLPHYSVLVPLYKESSAVIARLIAALEALDYPPEKLDIKLICEGDDFSTQCAITALSPPARMEIIRVPPSLPRTKPKACNVALAQCRGEFLVIYDAEDAPQPDQLRLAAAAFLTGGKHLACLQASLNYYNREENLLTQLFAIEYSTLFSFGLPALERLRLPIPLGGTSNHLRASALLDVGGWDAYNVTEDADLGLRLAYFGYHTRILPSLTLEESPITILSWLKQRVRWMKGYMQTWLVYMRDPSQLRRQLTPRGYYGMHFFFGAPVVNFLISPLFWLVGAAYAAGLALPATPPALNHLCIATLVIGSVMQWYFARTAIRQERWPSMRRALMLYPFYWVLHSLAALVAVGELLWRPHYWRKTRHGVSRNWLQTAGAHAPDLTPPVSALNSYDAYETTRQNFSSRKNRNAVRAA